jgi:hypothetical protein
MNEAFSIYLGHVADIYAFECEWRYGQTCFNVFDSLYPELADKIRGTERDPFHNDDRVPEFLGFVRDILSC